MLKLSSRDYSDPYILDKGTVTVAKNVVAATVAINANKIAIPKNSVPFT